jgi:hypothetical protein
VLFRIDPVDHGQEIVLVTEFSVEVHDHQQFLPVPNTFSIYGKTAAITASVS